MASYVKGRSQCVTQWRMDQLLEHGMLSALVARDVIHDKQSLHAEAHHVSGYGETDRVRRWLTASSQGHFKAIPDVPL
jgi:hypothetical protein